MYRKSLLGLVLASMIAVSASADSKREASLEKISQDCKRVDYSDLPDPREDLDEKILKNAAENQIVMFGERHVCWVADNLYVAYLLPELKELGYSHITAEILQRDQDLLYSYFDGDEVAGKKLQNKYCDIDGSFLTLFKKAHELGFEVHCIDTLREKNRDRKMFNNMLNGIFNEDSDAKVVVFIGADHLPEDETYLARPGPPQKVCSWLGCYLNRYTDDRTFTVDLTEYPSPVDLVAFPN